MFPCCTTVGFSGFTRAHEQWFKHCLSTVPQGFDACNAATKMAMSLSVGRHQDQSFGGACFNSNQAAGSLESATSGVCPLCNILLVQEHIWGRLEPKGSGQLDYLLQGQTGDDRYHSIHSTCAAMEREC